MLMVAPSIISPQNLLIKLTEPLPINHLQAKIPNSLKINQKLQRFNYYLKHYSLFTINFKNLSAIRGL